MLASEEDLNIIRRDDASIDNWFEWMLQQPVDSGMTKAQTLPARNFDPYKICRRLGFKLYKHHILGRLQNEAVMSLKTKDSSNA